MLRAFLNVLIATVLICIKVSSLAQKYYILFQLYNGNDNLKGLDAICEIRISQGLNLYEETVQELFKEVDKAISEGKEGNFTAYW